jgi:hypothetical protein
VAYVFFLFFVLSLFGIGDDPTSVTQWLISLALLACWLILGRWETNKHTAKWQAAARHAPGTYVARPADDLLQQFGHAPWHTWARATALRALDTISGTERQRAFWLLDVLHREWSLHIAGGFSYQTSFAIVRLAGQPTGVLHPLPAAGKLKAMHNGGYLFVWRDAWGSAVGKALHPDEMLDLLKVALDLAPAGDRSVTAPAVASAKPSARRRVATAVGADRAIPVFVLLAWVFIVGAPFLPTGFSTTLLTLPALVLAFVGLDLRRVWSTCHFALLSGCALAATFNNALRFYGVPLGICAIVLIHLCASSKNTHRDVRGRLLWGHRDDA